MWADSERLHHDPRGALSKTLLLTQKSNKCDTELFSLPSCWAREPSMPRARAVPNVCSRNTIPEPRAPLSWAGRNNLTKDQRTVFDWLRNAAEEPESFPLPPPPVASGRGAPHAPRFSAHRFQFADRHSPPKRRTRRLRRPRGHRFSAAAGWDGKHRPARFFTGPVRPRPPAQVRLAPTPLPSRHHQLLPARNRPAHNSPGQVTAIALRRPRRGPPRAAGAARRRLTLRATHRRPPQAPRAAAAAIPVAGRYTPPPTGPLSSAPPSRCPAPACSLAFLPQASPALRPPPLASSRPAANGLQKARRPAPLARCPLYQVVDWPRKLEPPTDSQSPDWPRRPSGRRLLAVVAKATGGVLGVVCVFAPPRARPRGRGHGRRGEGGEGGMFFVSPEQPRRVSRGGQDGGSRRV